MCTLYSYELSRQHGHQHYATIRWWWCNQLTPCDLWSSRLLRHWHRFQIALLTNKTHPVANNATVRSKKKEVPEEGDVVLGMDDGKGEIGMSEMVSGAETCVLDCKEVFFASHFRHPTRMLILLLPSVVFVLISRFFCFKCSCHKMVPNQLPCLKVGT